MASTYPTIIASRSTLASYVSATASVLLNVLVTETGFTATYKYDSASTATADGQFVIIPSNSPAEGRWLIGYGGSFPHGATNRLSKTANYTVTQADVASGSVVIDCNATGGSFTITIPPSLGVSATTPLVTVVKTDSSANAVILSDGSATVAILTFAIVGNEPQSYNVYSTGTVLRVI